MGRGGKVLIAAGVAAFIAFMAAVAVFTSGVVDDASDQAADLTDPRLSDASREVLGLTDEAYLWEGAAPAAVVSALADAAPGDEAAVVEVRIFSDAADVTVVDRYDPNRTLQLEWLLGEVEEPPDPVADPDAVRFAFQLDDVDWSLVAELVERTLDDGPGDGAVDHVLVGRDTSEDPSEPVHVWVHLDDSGPSAAAGYVQYALDGTMVHSSL